MGIYKVHNNQVSCFVVDTVSSIVAGIAQAAGVYCEKEVWLYVGR